jgi:hypothetical protein
VPTVCGVGKPSGSGDGYPTSKNNEELQSGYADVDYNFGQSYEIMIDSEYNHIYYYLDGCKCGSRSLCSA